MAVYEFRCAEHGPADVVFPIGKAPLEVGCPDCGLPAARVFAAPRVSFTSARSRAISGAIEQAEKTAERPDVVTSLPRKRETRTRPRPVNPNWTRLPRP